MRRIALGTAHRSVAAVGSANDAHPRRVGDALFGRIIDGVEQVVLPLRASNRVEWVRGEQLLLPRAAAAHGCDLVHSLASTAPVRGRFRRVVTIHDLHYAVVPEAHFGLRGLGMRVLVPAAARASHRIITDSQTTADDLGSHLGAPAGKVDVVPLGARLPEDVGATSEAELRRNLSLADRPVLLSASAKRPHKNLLRLIEAFAGLPAPRPVLVLPGYPTPHEAQLRDRAAALGVTADVRFLAWVSAEDLEGLYALATGFVFPSLYEGFGLPVLEAMARGVPVACSDRGAVAEVADGAARQFDPEDVAAICAALGRLVTPGADRERLVVAGYARAREFTWERTAAGTMQTYLRAIQADVGR